MPRTFAFLRAVNVGGHTVTMARLKALFEALGLRNVETFLASGNLIFDAGGTKEAVLREKIEAHLLKALDFEVTTFLRTEGELVALVKGCPFDESEVSAAKALNIALLHAPLSLEAEARLQTLRSEQDAFRVSGREVWWLCRVKQSESKFSNTVFEKTVKTKVTFRGFNTLVRLAAKFLKA
jgi:uncharacterized protein (DUF1697 family)